MNNVNRNEIFHELDEKTRKWEERRIYIDKIKKIKLYFTLVVLAASATLALKKYSDYTNKPVQIVATDILANEGFIITDDGRKVEARKFGLEDEDVLYAYMKNEDISSDELKEAICNYAKSKGFDENLVFGKVKEDYPELFPSIEEIHKTR